MLENLSNDISKLEKNVSFDSNDVYYFNAQRSKELILLLQNRHDNFDEQNIYDVFRDSLGIDDIKNITLNTSK
ncbi:MAG: hypothetical protein WCJ39_06930 [bacterium]